MAIGDTAVVEPCVIADSRKKMTGIAIVCVFFTQLGVTETLRQEPSSIFAWLAVACFGLAGCWSARRAWRPRSHVVISDDGVTYLPVGLNLAWNEIARARIESYQTTTNLHRRLVIVGRDADLVASRWASSCFRAPAPRTGRVEVELALTTPSWERIAAAIEHCSGREVDTRRVSPFAGVRARG